MEKIERLKKEKKTDGNIFSELTQRLQSAKDETERLPAEIKKVKAKLDFATEIIMASRPAG
jgi:chromosome segregation ATPase